MQHSHTHHNIYAGFEVITTVTMKPCLPPGYFLGLLSDPEDGSSTLLRNLGELLPRYTSNKIVFFIIRKVNKNREIGMECSTHRTKINEYKLTKILHWNILKNESILVT
jgi:hypothetical protein